MTCKRCTKSGCAGCGSMSCACACVEARLTVPENRWGLAAIDVRIGDYRDFFSAAVAQLSSPALPMLHNLGTRDLDDPAIAWFDAWAVAADVLTFYRERLTNESYIRTARDEYAVRELAALVGFKPRPGVAATAYLAYLMESTAKPGDIPLRAKAQSVPGPGEQMQTFETDEKFAAHAEWSQMSPRSLRPARITLIDAMLRPSIRLQDASLVVRTGERVLFVFGSQPGFQVVREVASAKADILNDFIEVQLKPRLPFTLSEAMTMLENLLELRQTIAAAVPNNEAETLGFRQLADLVASFLLGGSPADSMEGAIQVERSNQRRPRIKDLASAVEELFKAILGRWPGVAFRSAKASSLETVLQTTRRLPATQLASGRLLVRAASRGLSAGGEERLAMLSATTPELQEALPQALSALPVSEVTPKTSPSVFLLRISAGAFGALAPPIFTSVPDVPPIEHPLAADDRKFAFLDAAYDGIHADSYVVFDRPFEARQREFISPNRILRIARVQSTQTVVRGAYRISGKATRLELVSVEDPVRAVQVIPEDQDNADLGMLRNTMYHAQSEAVRLAADVDETEVAGDRIELQTLVHGLQSGQRIIVTGERTDITDANDAPVSGVRGGELAMIGTVTLEANPLLPGDTLHTVIALVKPLAYRYKRSLCTVYGNVVKASHGETVSEVLGSGDASKVGQKFAGKRGPLTFTTAATTEGVESSEVVRVNGVRYHRVESLLDADGATHAYQLEIDRDGSATTAFGDGIHGARLPSGPQNVRVDYRVGIGSPGNVRAEQISLLTTRPLGVTGVVNPLRTSGGADRDGPERIRSNAPLAARVLSPLSRLVSVKDYEEFARRFAGIGHATATKLSDGAQQVVHVTVAGVDDIPLDPAGELLASLQSAYARYGDPMYPVEIGVRELKALMLQAKVGINPDASWDVVEPEVRSHLLNYFGFEHRRPGQASYLSEAIAVIQGTRGVVWVDVDRFGGVTENEVRDAGLLAEAIKQLRSSVCVDARHAGLNPNWKAGSSEPRFLAAQLLCVLPDVPGLLTLNLA
jgi:baseplate J-like protein